MATNASKSVSMIVHLHTRLSGTVGTSDGPHDVATSVTANDNSIDTQSNQSGRRLRNLFLVGNAVAWIVIILVARALFF
jgi:hypothetical protein